jgi:ribonuclease D
MDFSSAARAEIAPFVTPDQAFAVLPALRPLRRHNPAAPRRSCYNPARLLDSPAKYRRRTSVRRAFLRPDKLMADTVQFTASATIHLHRHDLPDGLDLGQVVAVDTEAMGLNPHRDRLCLVQLSAGDGRAHLVQIVPESLGGRGYDAPNLSRLLSDKSVTKLMHFARFDVALLQHSFGIAVGPTKCTKIAAKLVRTFTDRHGLRDLCRELLGVEISKQQQTSDWGSPELSSEQLAYAASDVLHLHALWARLEALLIREGRLELAQACFDFLPTRCRLDVLGYEDPDIFTH